MAANKRSIFQKPTVVMKSQSLKVTSAGTNAQVSIFTHQVIVISPQRVFQSPSVY